MEEVVSYLRTNDFEEACLLMSNGFVLSEISDWGSRDYPWTLSPAFYFEPYPNLEIGIASKIKYRTICRRSLFNQIKVKVPGVKTLRFKDNDGWYEVDATQCNYSKKKIKRIDS